MDLLDNNYQDKWFFREWCDGEWKIGERISLYIWIEIASEGKVHIYIWKKKEDVAMDHN